MAVKAKVSVKIGDVVRCQWFNIPDGKFYKEPFEAKVLKVGVHTFANLRAEQGVYVMPTNKVEMPFPVWLHQNEIRAIVTEAKHAKK